VEQPADGGPDKPRGFGEDGVEVDADAHCVWVGCRGGNDHALNDAKVVSKRHIEAVSRGFHHQEVVLGVEVVPLVLVYLGRGRGKRAPVKEVSLSWEEFLICINPTKFTSSVLSDKGADRHKPISFDRLFNSWSVKLSLRTQNQKKRQHRLRNAPPVLVPTILFE
jgi:hypothetical protein